MEEPSGPASFRVVAMARQGGRKLEVERAVEVNREMVEQRSEAR